MARVAVSWLEIEGVHVEPKVRVVVSWFELEAIEGEAVVVPPITEGSGGYHYRPDRRPLPVEGYGYGILPQIEGEAHGVVAAAGRSMGALPRLAGLGDAAAGTAGSSSARLTIKIMMCGVAGARGNGSGMIVKFKGAAVGRHDDDEAAIVAWLAAA